MNKARLEPPSCCDMRGMLSFYILWLLSKRSMSGQEIANELEKRRGTKPTAGTIYPALKELETKGLVTVRKEGRATIYTLTEDGREGAKEACDYFCSAFEEIFREHGAEDSRPTRKRAQSKSSIAETQKHAPSIH